ncbi:octopamine receptor Oamb isoform X3 [Linepithema humile]|uniref:octopamine receptor Oamb isoform X3 n=1 Tax=Linepithema humile TaxID=83485 RepID=UPI00062316E0|nr:PREDICTED: probable G-protein coupled receptor No9 isoform X3 [Linepithema humile]
MRELNATACAALHDGVEWLSMWNVVTLIVLAIVNIMVIVGNVLVILAVYSTNKLRNVTNMFIVSLAVADLMVGIAVLPFSATWEVYKVWVYGDLWCSVWLAVDVWMCTASILNLCAISLDRYLAVTRPVSYPQLMSTKRARLLVATVWVLSFLICFPPLVGWKDKRSHPTHNVTFPPYGPSNTTTILIPVKPCPWICELTNDAGYVVYRFDEQRLTLRIHRGRGSVHNGSNNGSSRSPDSSGRNSVKREKIKISVSYPSTETLNTKCNTLERTPSRCSQISVHYSNGQTQTQLCPTSRNTHLKVGGVNRVGSSKRPSRRNSCESQVTGDELSLREMTTSSEEKPRVMKLGKRNIKNQVKRFRMETKAAKTLGIIVGGFILCWLPFFTMYIVRAFCPNRIHPTIFSVLFWLGYCNSAINPCIYALFSKDFRFAFKKIICCKCSCMRRPDTLRRGSDGSQLAMRNPRTHTLSMVHGNGTVCVPRRNERSPSYTIRMGSAQQGISIDDSDPDPSSEPTHSQSESR